MAQGSTARALQMCPKCSENNTLTARSCIRCGCTLPSIPLLAKHTILNNRYIVIQVLGLGGFSAVYLALDQRMGNRRVAIKEVFHTDPSIVRQFEAEARLLMTLSHRALPKAIDWFKRFENDRYYFVTKFIDGISVWEYVNRKGRMSPSEALQLMKPVFDAVAYLHSQTPPLVHRDIKPQNILITKGKKVYLVDFGIPKVGGAGQKTMTGAKGVAPGFSPPEQYSATGEIDVRSDIYSLGATMYFLLTGKVPPEATERLQREASGQPSLEPIHSANALVSQQMEQTILIAMALHKDQRFNYVNEFLAGLREQAKLPHSTGLTPTSHYNLPPLEEPIQHGGWFASFFRTWAEACFHPVDFFDSVGRSNSLLEPLIFGVTVVLLSIIANAGMVFFCMPYALPTVLIALLFGLPFIPIAILIRSVILHIFLIIVGGAKKGLVMTIRTEGYAWAAYGFLIVPLIGGVVAFIYYLVLEIIGHARSHEVEYWRSTLAVFLPFILAFCISSAFLIISVLLGLRHLLYLLSPPPFHPVNPFIRPH